MTTSSNPVRGPEAARGPLVVSTANPRYFRAASDGHKAAYLTGSHIWNNLHDGLGAGAACAETSERLDYRAYSTSSKRTATTSSGWALGAVEATTRS